VLPPSAPVGRWQATALFGQHDQLFGWSPKRLPAGLVGILDAAGLAAVSKAAPYITAGAIVPEAGNPPPAPDAKVTTVWSDVLAFLETARFVDLLLPGWIDRTGAVPVCRPLAFDVYLQAETGLIQLASVNSCGGLRIRLADQIDYDPALTGDPDEEPAAASVGAHYLTAQGSARCTAMRLFTNNESAPDDGIFRAAEMTFDNTHTIFFDPFWPDGIRLGTGNTPDLWLAEDRSQRLQEAFGPLKETTWAASPPVTNASRTGLRTAPRRLRSSVPALPGPWIKRTCSPSHAASRTPSPAEIAHRSCPLRSRRTTACRGIIPAVARTMPANTQTPCAS
jgi:hypothetical protein